MDPRRAQIERNAHFTRGPRFFREGEGLMFEFIIDASNVVGPRPATEGDKRNHLEAWEAFEEDEPRLVATEHHQGQPAKRAYHRRKSLPDEAA